jgi:hypothetical protein
MAILDRSVLYMPDNNFVDVALAKPVMPILAAPEYMGIGAIPGYQSTYRLGDRVIKYGQTTGMTTGIIESVDADTKLLGAGIFRNQTTIVPDSIAILTTPNFGLPGDSGSVILDEKSKNVLAVLYGGILNTEGNVVLAYPFYWLTQLLGIRPAPGSLGTKLINPVPDIVHDIEELGAYARNLTRAELQSLTVVKASQTEPQYQQIPPVNGPEVPPFVPIELAASYGLDPGEEEE